MIKENDAFGIYTVKEILSERTADRHRLYLVECNICHKQFKLPANDFAYASTISNICKHNNINWVYKNHRLESIWFKMKARCYDPTQEDYYFYGARGIKICEEWLTDPTKFEVWAMGHNYADNLTIDRIDSKKDYCPENCRWISAEDNSRFKSTTNYIEVNGLLKSGRQWSTYFGLGVNRINKLIRNYGLDYTVNFIKDKLEN